MIIPRYCLILAIPSAVRLQTILKHFKIAVIIMRIYDMGFFIKSNLITLSQFLRCHGRIVKIFLRWDFIMYCTIGIYLWNKRNLYLLRRINLIMFLWDACWLLLHQNICTVRKHPALSPVVVLPAAPVCMYGCHIPVCIILFQIPLNCKLKRSIGIFLEKCYIVITAIFLFHKLVCFL